MPFDLSTGPKGTAAQKSKPSGRKIAVIGAGVSGLSAAWLLSTAHQVVVYERDKRLGGHANTVSVEMAGKTYGVDAGFIVFNEPSYPNFTALLKSLGVPTEQSCMSFAASINGGEIEYSGQTLSSVFANRKSIVSPRFWGMLNDIARFHRAARKALRTGIDDTISLGTFVDLNGFGGYFRENFLKPMAAAIWSTPSQDVLNYPAGSFVRFFSNHGLLQVLNLPIWHTVSGGSRRYVEQISKPFAGAARLDTGVARIIREGNKVRVIDESGGEDQFDDVVIATHADAALKMLDAPSEEERALLGAFGYQPNRAVMHTDDRFMPLRRRAWASWNYIGDTRPGAPTEPSVSYWMNRLQNLDCPKDIFVTLNPQTDIPDEHMIAVFDYDHPVFDLKAGAAQKNIWSLQGRGGVWYCGAHFGQGFHEDGLQAGLAAAEAVGGVRRPWDVAEESARIYIHDAPGGRPIAEEAA